VQVLYAASETGLATPVVLRGLEVRANPVSTNPAKSSIDLMVSLSASPFTRTTMTTTFAANHGPNLTTVYNRKLTSVVATQPSFLGAGSGMIMFDAPFIYLPANGSLLVDFDVASQPAGTWSIQSAASSPLNGRHSDIGSGCNGLSLTSTGGGSGLTLTYTLAGGPANAPGIFVLATRALPAPIPVPGNPGCNLYQELLVILPVTLNAAGGWTLPLSYPADPGLRGANIFGQLGAINLAANRFDLSQSRVVTITNAHDGARLYSLNSNTSPTGTLQLGSMIVIRFQN
jgi:hypothetical protein